MSVLKSALVDMALVRRVCATHMRWLTELIDDTLWPARQTCDHSKDLHQMPSGMPRTPVEATPHC
eukprot:11296662-Alexandrium_andersonii.AAC.1